MNPFKALVVASALTMNLPEVEQFLAGLIMGLIQKDDLTKIQQCLTDGTGLANEINTAISDFEKGDVADIIAGIEEVGKIIQDLPADLGDCKDMSADIARIEAWAQIFKDPVKLAETLAVNVIKHFSQITTDIGKVESDLKAKKYDAEGQDIADILVAALGPVPQMAPPPKPKPKMTLKQVEDFLSGFMYGLIKTDDSKEIAQCLEDQTSLSYEILMAVAEFEKIGSERAFVGGLFTMDKLIQNLPSEFHDCEGIREDLDRIERWAQIFKDPKKLKPILEKNVKKNLKKIEADQGMLKKDIKDFKKIGMDIADIMVESIYPVPKDVPPKDPEDLTFTQW